jgi:hypothetical protein
LFKEKASSENAVGIFVHRKASSGNAVGIFVRIASRDIAAVLKQLAEHAVSRNAERRLPRVQALSQWDSMCSFD